MDIQNVNDFFESRSKEDAKSQQVAADNSSSKESVELTVPGKYRMKVNTRSYIDKKGNFRTSPELVPTKKNSLMLNFTLEVIDGTPDAPAGSFMYSSVVVVPASGATEEKINNTIRMAKPRLVAMLGVDKISYSKEWIYENLLPEYEKDGGSWVLKKDHNMKKEIIAHVEVDWDSPRKQLKVKHMHAALPGEKSVSDKEPNVTTNEFETAEETSSPEILNAAKIAEGLIQDGPSDGVGSDSVPDVSEF